MLAGDIVHLGLPLIAQRFIPEYTHHNQLDALRGFLIGSRWITFGLATAFALLGAGAIYRAHAVARSAHGAAVLSRLRVAAVLHASR